jgi:hypothetical protein
LGLNVTVINVTPSVGSALGLSMAMHVLLTPEQPPPDQPETTEPEAGVAVTVTCVRPNSSVWHVPPPTVQSSGDGIPVGLLVTVPEPGPLAWTIKFAGSLLKATLTFVSAFTVSVQLEAEPAELEQGNPSQPPKALAGAGLAVRVTWVPAVTFIEHAVAATPQSMPAGLLVTVPEPTSGPNPTVETVSVYWGVGGSWVQDAWSPSSIGVVPVGLEAATSAQYPASGVSPVTLIETSWNVPSAAGRICGAVESAATPEAPAVVHHCELARSYLTK